MLIEEVMTSNVFTIDQSDSVYDACKSFITNQVGSLVVMDKKIIVGIITERDAVEKILINSKNPKKTKVREIMTPHIKTVHALAPLEKAAQIMKQYKIKKLPVVLNNEIVGIITETDLTRTIDAFSEAVEELTQFYADSRQHIEHMMDEWGNILVGLKEHKKLTENKNIEGLKNL